MFVPDYCLSRVWIDVYCLENGLVKQLLVLLRMLLIYFVVFVWHCLLVYACILVTRLCAVAQFAPFVFNLVGERLLVVVKVYEVFFVSAKYVNRPRR